MLFGRISVALVILFLATSCTQKPKEVAGNVFVVTAGGETKKLGLVPVQIYPAKDISLIVERTRTALLEELDGLEKKNKSYEETLSKEMQAKERLSKEYADLVLRQMEFNRTMPKPPDSSSFTIEPTGSAASNVELRIAASKAHKSALVAYDSDLAKWKQQSDFLEKETDRKKQESSALGQKIDGLLEMNRDVISRLKTFDEEYFSAIFSDLSKPVFSTKTDGDGNFSIRIPPEGDFVIAASTSRQVEHKTEFYYWLLKLPKDFPKDKKFSLNNDNFLGSNHPDSAVPLPIR